MAMHEQAKVLNDLLRDSPLATVLSEYGTGLYFPKGIVAQSVQAGRKAYAGNGTAGVALERGHHMTLSSFKEALVGIDADGMVSYAPTAGVVELRELWQRDMLRKNPLLNLACTTLPVVTAGLTGALSIAADLFVNRGDHIIVAQPCWDNYELIFSVRHGATLVGVPFFAGGALAIDALRDAVMGCDAEKVTVLLNFPHNPTGYAPTNEEATRLADALVCCAARGKRLVVIIDDAYFGLFHARDVFRQSMFALLAGSHERIVVVKCDAATKESLAWGFRIGFLTIAAQNLDETCKEALVGKVMGAIRASVSSCPRLSQTLLVKAMRDTRYSRDTEQVAAVMAQRWALAKSALASHSDDWDLLRPLPFNSGYFFSLECPGDPEQLRLHLLDKHGIGTVSLEGRYLRIAYSAIDTDSVEAFIDTVYRGARESWR